MSAIGPGSLLLCVDASGAWADALTEGRVYEVRALRPRSYGSWCYHCGKDCGALPDVGVGHHRRDGSRLWPALCRFIPAGKRGDFTELLNAKPVETPAEPEGVEA